MIISFKNTSPQEAVDSVSSGLSDWDFGRHISLELKGSKLTLTIKKLGTSKIEFNVTGDKEKTIFNKSSETITLSHKAIRPMVESKLITIIEKQNGSVAS
jgi:hypothetical protein